MIEKAYSIVQGIWLDILWVLTEKLHVPHHIINLAVITLLVLLICLIILVLSKQLSQKSLFTLDLSRYENKSDSRPMNKLWGVLLYALKYLILFPIYTIIWGSLFIICLIFLTSPENYHNVIFFSTVTIALIRIIAYFDEGYAQELAKMLPLLLLVTIMLNPDTLSKITFAVDFSALLEGNILMLSVGFIVGEEWFLRAANGVYWWHKQRRKKAS